MPQITIYVSDELHGKMKSHKKMLNYSKIASLAIEKKINYIETMKNLNMTGHEMMGFAMFLQSMAGNSVGIKVNAVRNT